MATQPKKPQSIFPDVPREIPVIDVDGDFTALWSLFFGQVAQALQGNFSNEGILFPALSADDIMTIQNIYTPYHLLPLPHTIPDISGKTVFDTTNRVSKQFVITYDGSTPPNIQTAIWKTLMYV